MFKLKWWICELPVKIWSQKSHCIVTVWKAANLCKLNGITTLNTHRGNNGRVDFFYQNKRNMKAVYNKSLSKVVHVTSCYLWNEEHLTIKACFDQKFQVYEVVSSDKVFKFFFASLKFCCVDTTR